MPPIVADQRGGSVFVNTEIFKKIKFHKLTVLRPTKSKPDRPLIVQALETVATSRSFSPLWESVLLLDSL